MRGPQPHKLVHPAIGGRLTETSNVRKLQRDVGALERRLGALDETIVELRDFIEAQAAEIAELKTENARRRGGRPKKVAAKKVGRSRTAEPTSASAA